jgi:hypothetical protein
VDLFASQTPALLALVRAGANRSTSIAELWPSTTIEDLFAADARLRPPGHAADSRAFAVRYLGNQRGVIAAELRRRYPLSAPYMPNAPLPYIRQWARKDAGCYQQEPQRFLVDRQRTPIEDPALTTAYDALVEASHISEVAPESERRARTGIKASTVHVGYLPPIGDDDGRPLLRHYWPHDVVVICHPSYPGEDEAVIFAALRQAAENDSEQRWLCFKRDFVEDAGIITSWGAWQTAMWAGADDAVMWEEYAGALLPVVSLRLEPPDGGFWPACEPDSYAVADQLNTSRSNIEYVADLQGHSNRVVSSDTYDETEQPVGPDSTLKLRTGDSASYMTPTPAFEALQAIVDEKQRAVGVARGNDPNEYTDKPGPAESGVARLVAKFPHELTLREAREAVRRFDERLCRVLLDVADSFDPVLPSFGVDVRPRTQLAPSVVFEDPASKQQRALTNLQEGAISPAEYAVEVGLQSSLAKAVEAGFSDVARMRAPPAATPALPTATEALATALLTPPEVASAAGE